MAFDGTTGSLPGAVLGGLAGGLVEGLSVDTPVVEPRGAVNGATTPSIVVVVVLADGTAGPLTDLVVDRLDDGLLELLADEGVDVVVDKLPAILLVVVSDGRPRVVRVAIVVGSLGVGVLIEGTTDGRFSSTVDAVVVDVSAVLGNVVAVDFSGGFADGVVIVVFSGEVVGELAGALSTDRAAELWVVVDGVGSTVTEGSVVVDVVLIDETTGGLDCGGGGEALLEVVVVDGSIDGVAVLADSDVDVLLVVVFVVGGGGGGVVVVVDGTTTFVVCGVVVVVVREVMILSSVVGDNVVVSGNVIGAGGGGVVVGSSGLETGILLFLKFCRLICRGK